MTRSASSFRFKKAVALTTAFCAALFTVLYLMLFNFTPQDQEKYHELMLVSNPDLGTENHSAPYTAKQKRQGIQKTFTYLKGQTPLKAYLLSKEADLVLDRQAGRTQIIEQMQGIKAYMQEELFYVLSDGRQAVMQPEGKLLIRHACPAKESSWISCQDDSMRPMQIIRYLEADSGSYFYKTDTCIANRVTIKRYVVPGHELVINEADSVLLMQGTADNIHFTMGEGQPYFIAYQFCASIFMPFPLLSALPSDFAIKLSAGQADYQDDKITLTHNVEILHQMGRAYAQLAEVYALPQEKKTRLSQIFMKDKVSVQLTSGAHLACDAADFDVIQQKGAFSGHVVYQELFKGSQQEAIPFILSCDEMLIETKDGQKGEKNIQKLLQQITASGHVKIDYEEQFFLSADQALYQQVNLPANLTRRLRLWMDHAQQRCSINSLRGDVVEAKKIEMDLTGKAIIFDDVQGKLVVVHEDAKEQFIDFTCDRLLWDNRHKVLSMSGDVAIHQQAVAHLYTKGQVQFFQHQLEGKWSIKKMTAEGETSLVYEDADKENAHTLTTKGSVIVDHVSLLTTIISPKAVSGAVKGSDQIYFQDHYGEIFADKALLYYQMQDNKIVPSKIWLEGNVRLKDQHQDGRVLHYALADFVDYSPQDREAVFTAKLKKRVLFYDKINYMQVSASALKIKRDEITKKESIKGVGDVRFNFVDQEYSQLRKRFKQEAI